MSVCFEKARELGRLILQSEPALRLCDTDAALAENPGSETAVRDVREAEKYLRDYTSQVVGIINTTVYGADAPAGCGCEKRCPCPAIRP